MSKMQRIQTRFTERFGIDHPIMLAPMDQVASGELAAAVTQAGGLGMIGGGYGNSEWLKSAFASAGNHPVGVGFITWSVLATTSTNNRGTATEDSADTTVIRQVVQQAIDQSPSLLMVSFGDAEAIIELAKAADIPTCWQIQRLSQAQQAIDAGVDVIVVQGQEAGGHGMDRGLTSLLPAVRTLAGSQQIILAAGGIADGRGLASALMLGADGIMMGTRFWASVEASGSEKAKTLITQTGGDQTIRTRVFDIARNADWPHYFTGRVVHNDFSQRWHSKLNDLIDNPDSHRQYYDDSDPEDFSTRVLIAGEAADLIERVLPAAEIIESTISQATQLLSAAPDFVIHD
jgi:nitronate monooxygenase